MSDNKAEGIVIRAKPPTWVTQACTESARHKQIQPLSQLMERLNICGVQVV